jgi:hypothetical protein
MQEDDGSLKVETVLSRRRLRRPDLTGQPAVARGDSLQLGRRTKSGSNIPNTVHRGFSTVPARRDKYYYEYLVKYRGLSYLKTEWLTYYQIGEWAHVVVMLGSLNGVLIGMLCASCRVPGSAEQAGAVPVAQEDRRGHDRGHGGRHLRQQVSHPSPPPHLAVTACLLTANRTLCPWCSYCVVEKVLDCREVEVEVTDDAAGSDKQEEQERVRDDEGVAQEPAPSPEELQKELAEARAARALPTDSRVPGGAPSGKGWFPWVRCRYVFNRIAQDEYADWFADPVDTSIYTDYLNVVERGMCLAEVRAELEKEEPYGNDVALFAADMRLIWKNCEEYNLVQSAVYQAGEMFSRIFERLMTGWVMNFKSGLHKWKDAPSRPWETFCLACTSTRPDKEPELVACDFCEGQYHIGCLEPPLVDVPAGPWLCQGCEQMEREGAIGHHSHQLEEALREKVARQCRTTTLKKQKMYLVKWKDLGNASCTWEKPEDLQDKAKIAEYHQALLQQLTTRAYELIPANSAREDPHFLRTRLPSPDALLPDCGVKPHAFSLPSQPSGLIESPAPERRGPTWRCCRQRC